MTGACQLMAGSKMQPYHHCVLGVDISPGSCAAVTSSIACSLFVVATDS